VSPHHWHCQFNIELADQQEKLNKVNSCAGPEYTKESLH